MAGNSNINFSSTHDMSRLFFGGYIKTKVDEPVLNELGQPVVIKTGQNRGHTKTKKVERSVYIQGLGLTPRQEWKTKKADIYQTNEKVLTEIINSPSSNNKAVEIASLLLKIREKEKMLSTYYVGFEKFIDNESLIHGQINHCSTQTGRPSSVRPNLQNISN